MTGHRSESLEQRSVLSQSSAPWPLWGRWCRRMRHRHTTVVVPAEIRAQGPWRTLGQWGRPRGSLGGPGCLVQSLTLCWPADRQDSRGPGGQMPSGGSGCCWTPRHNIGLGEGCGSLGGRPGPASRQFKGLNFNLWSVDCDAPNWL